MITGNDIVGEAFRVFERWKKEYDPEGEMDILDAVMAYSEWAITHSIEPYLDAQTISV